MLGWLLKEFDVNGKGNKLSVRRHGVDWGHVVDCEPLKRVVINADDENELFVSRRHTYIPFDHPLLKWFIYYSWHSRQ